MPFGELYRWIGNILTGRTHIPLNTGVSITNQTKVVLGIGQFESEREYELTDMISSVGIDSKLNTRNSFFYTTHYQTRLYSLNIPQLSIILKLYSIKYLRH